MSVSIKYIPHVEFSSEPDMGPQCIFRRERGDISHGELVSGSCDNGSWGYRDIPEENYIILSRFSHIFSFLPQEALSPEP